MKKLAAGNWKMNGSHAALAEVAALLSSHPAPACEMLLCPPATLISPMSQAAQGSKLMVGGQDCHATTSGAHTGDISAQMLDTAASAVARAGLTGKVRLALADASAFQPERSFGREKFDRIFISYAVSMIPGWHDVIRDAAGFRQALQAAYDMACRGYLVTLGIQPDSPHTGYGYIQQGELLVTWDPPQSPQQEGQAPAEAAPAERMGGGLPVYRVKRFKEKPDLETARQFLASGDHLWNSGIFIWKVSTLMDAMQRHMPVLYSQLEAIDRALGAPQEAEVMAKVWQGVQNISVDVGLLEKADNVVVIPLQVGWNDVGSWAQLGEILPVDEDGNIVLGADHLGIDTTGSLIWGRGDRLIATIGLEDMVIVDTGDVLMVCPKSRAQDVKLIIDELQKQKKDKYL